MFGREHTLYNKKNPVLDNIVIQWWPLELDDKTIVSIRDTNFPFTLWINVNVYFVCVYNLSENIVKNVNVSEEYSEWKIFFTLIKSLSCSSFIMFWHSIFIA